MRTLIATVFILILGHTHLYASEKRIGILLFDGVLTSDITAPAEVFGTASKQSWFTDYTVTFINSQNKTSVTTEEGIEISTNATLNDKLDLDVLIIPSSYDMNPHIKNSRLINFVRQQASSVAWLASNCSGAFILAEAGLLNGKRATTWAGGEKELAAAYPKVKVVYDTNLVEEGNIITSNGGAVSYEAAIKLLAKLSSKKNAMDIYEALQIHRLKGAGFEI